MKTIYLTQGRVAIVDDADFDWLNQWKWYAQYSHHTQSFYAMRCRYPGKVRIHMSRLILGLTDSKVGADHRNGNTLDNQRQNLRVATRRQNAANSRTRKDCLLGIKGVSKVGNRYKVQMTLDGQKLYLGSFATPEEAAEAYRLKALDAHGEYARIA